MVFQGVVAARCLILLHIAFENTNISLANTLPTFVKCSVGSFSTFVHEDFQKQVRQKELNVTPYY